MKKALTYTVAAFLLGIVVMLLPAVTLLPPKTLLPLKTPTPTSTLPPAFSEALQNTSARAVKGLDSVKEGFSVAEGVTPFPFSLLYAGLIFLTGFIAALSVFLILRRKVFKHLTAPA